MAASKLAPVSLTFNFSRRTGNISVEAAVKALEGYKYSAGRYVRGEDFAEISGSTESKSFVRLAVSR